MRKVDLMVFDFDGTLVDSLEDIVAAVNHTLSMLNIPMRTSDTIRTFIGDGVHKLIERSLGDEYIDLLPDALEKFKVHYGEHLLDNTQPYENVFEMLNFFKNKKKVIITNKLSSFTIKIANALRLANYFDEIIGSDSKPFKKPDSRLLYPLFQRFDVMADRTVVIGDGVNDILLAKNANALSCAFLNGYTTKKNLMVLNPDYVFADMMELTALFC